MRRTGRWVPIGFGLLMIVGCSTAVDGEPTADVAASAETSTTAAEPTTPWDPCTIPDEAIERAGLNVSTKESGIFGRDQYGFKICGWENTISDNKYYLSIFVGLKGIDYIADTPNFDRLQSVQVGARNATQFQQVGADAAGNCGVAFTAGSELIMSTLNTSALVDGPAHDPCTELNSVVTKLDSELPS